MQCQHIIDPRLLFLAESIDRRTLCSKRDTYSIILHRRLGWSLSRYGEQVVEAYLLRLAVSLPCASSRELLYGHFVGGFKWRARRYCVVSDGSEGADVEQKSCLSRQVGKRDDKFPLQTSASSLIPAVLSALVRTVRQRPYARVSDTVTFEVCALWFVSTSRVISFLIIIFPCPFSTARKCHDKQCLHE